MKTYFGLLLAAILCFGFTAESAFSAARYTGTPSVPLPIVVKQMLNSSSTAAPIMSLGTQVTEKKLNVLRCVYDYSVLGGLSGSTYKLKDASGGDCVAPKGAIVKRAYIQTITTFSGGLIRIGGNVDNDLLASTAGHLLVSTAPGLTIGAPIATVATMYRVPQNEALTLSVGGASNLSAGKLNVFVEYFLGDTF